MSLPPSFIADTRELVGYTPTSASERRNLTYRKVQALPLLLDAYEEAVRLLEASVEATTELLRAVNFCEPTARLDALMVAEGEAQTSRNAARAFLASQKEG